MRAHDFSGIPVPQGHTGAVFVGMNEYRRPWHLAEQVLVWLPLVRRLKKTPGYLWHLSYFRPPLRIGLVVGFESRDALLEFARTDEHHAIMHWLVGTDSESGARPADPDSAPVKAGFIRILEADPVGYVSGPWRADEDKLELIQHWGARDDGSASNPPHELPEPLRAKISGAGRFLAFGRALAGSAVDSVRTRRHR